MAMMVTKTHRQARHFPKGFCPRDLQYVRLFYAPLQRSTDAGSIGDPTFTRATVATQLDQDASTVDDVTSGTARFEANGYLSEGSRENLCLHSEAADNAYWVKTRATVSADAVAAPDGNTTADSIDEDGTAASSHFVNSGSMTITADASVTYSVYVKASNRSWVLLRVLDTGTGTDGFKAYFDVNTGATGTGSADGSGTFTSSSIEDVGSGWYRCIMTGKAEATDTTVTGYLYAAAGDNDNAFDGASQSSVYVWGAQLEEGAFASSYIPTTTAAVTRNADDLKYLISGNFETSKGTYFLEASSVGDHQRGGFLLIGDNNTDYHRLARDPDGEDIEWLGETGNVLIYQIVTTADDLDTTPKPVAFAWATDDFETYSSGVSRGTDTSGTPTASPGTTMQVGSVSDFSASREAFGHTRNLQIFRERLTGFNVARIA